MIKLSTCMVLKNEGSTIYRALDSIEHVTDEFVIGIDKTTSDNTREEVNRFFEDYPNQVKQVYEYDWPESFAKARNQGMDKAKGEYIFIFDGHEFVPDSWMNIIANQRINCRQVLKQIINDLGNEDVDEIFLALYQQPFTGEVPNNWFLQPRIYRNGKSKVDKYKDKTIRFGRDAHNVINFTRPEFSIQYPECIIVHDAPEENRVERAAQRQEMNIKQLNEDLKKNPKDTRAMFYLANTYLEGEKIEESLEQYNNYLETQNTDNSERYTCHMHKGLALKKKMDVEITPEVEKDFVDTLLQCIRINPTKRDAYMLLGAYYRKKEQYEKSIFYLNTGAMQPPENSRMFSNGATYTWLPHQEMAQTYKAMGRKEHAIAHLKQALNYVNMDGWHKEIKELSGDKSNIYLVDHIGTFTADFIKHLQSRNYNVVTSKEFSHAHAKWADKIFIEWGDKNAEVAQMYKGKVVCRIHGYEAYQKQELIKSLDWDIDSVIFVADHIQKMAKGMNSNLNGQCKVIKNGVDLDNFYIEKYDRDKKACGVIGYQNSKKNPMRLASIIKKNKDITFHLRIDWQDLYLKEAFEYETRKCKNIVYHGRYENMNDFYNQVSYILCASDIESFSYAIGEGMACGCTPLIYNWKGAKDIWRSDFIFTDQPKFELRDMKAMREYIVNNYPLDKQMHEMERTLMGVA